MAEIANSRMTGMNSSRDAQQFVDSLNNRNQMIPEISEDSSEIQSMRTSKSFSEESYRKKSAQNMIQISKFETNKELSKFKDSQQKKEQ